MFLNVSNVSKERSQKISSKNGTQVLTMKIYSPLRRLQMYTSDTHYFPVLCRRGPRIKSGRTETVILSVNKDARA